MLFGLIQYMRGWKYLGEAGIHPSVTPASPQGAQARRQVWIGALVIIAIIGLIAALVQQNVISIQTVTNGFSWLYLAIVVGFFVWLFQFGQWTREERKRLIVILVLFCSAAVFWSAFEQAASTLNLFAQRNTDTKFLGIAYPPSWLQSVNAAMIIIFAPVFAWLWLRLGKHDPSSPTKFAFGLPLRRTRFRGHDRSSGRVGQWAAGESDVADGHLLLAHRRRTLPEPGRTFFDDAARP